MTLWKPTQPLLLASGSVTRLRMLEAAGLPVEAQPAALDERAIAAAVPGEPPRDLAGVLAAAKARAVAQHEPGRVVVAADQTLSCGGKAYNKPADRAAARQQLLELRGRPHALHAAVVVQVDDTAHFAAVRTATLTMRNFSEAFLDAYLEAAGDAATESVGGYQVERLGIQLFSRIEGDHFTILGLPLLPLLGFFREVGWLAD